MKKASHNCCHCHRPFYASYKGKYYCTIHLEEILAKDKHSEKKNDSTDSKL